MIRSIDGFVCIKPLEDSDFFVTPEQKGNLRLGEVVSIGGDIFHASGAVLPCPVKVGDKALFQYIENEDFTDPKDGKHYYLVSYNALVGIYDESSK